MRCEHGFRDIYGVIESYLMFIIISMLTTWCCIMH